MVFFFIILKWPGCPWAFEGVHERETCDVSVQVCESVCVCVHMRCVLCAYACVCTLTHGVHIRRGKII